MNLVMVGSANGRLLDCRPLHELILSSFDQSCGATERKVRHLQTGKQSGKCLQFFALQLHRNERDGVPNYRCIDGLLSRLFRRGSKKTSNFRVSGLYEGKSPVTGEFLSQWASNAENVSIWWCHLGQFHSGSSGLVKTGIIIYQGHYATFSVLEWMKYIYITHITWTESVRLDT